MPTNHQSSVNTKTSFISRFLLYWGMRDLISKFNWVYLLFWHCVTLNIRYKLDATFLFKIEMLITVVIRFSGLKNKGNSIYGTHFFPPLFFFVILPLKSTKSDQWISGLPRSTNPLKQGNIKLWLGRHLLLNIGPIKIYTKLWFSYRSNAAFVTLLLGFTI